MVANYEAMNRAYCLSVISVINEKISIISDIIIFQAMPFTQSVLFFRHFSH